MTLTAEQKLALDRGEAIETTVEGQPCALIKWSTFCAMQEIIDEMIEDADPRVMRPLVGRMIARDDANDAAKSA